MNAECYYGGRFHSFMWYSRQEIRRRCKQGARESGDETIIIHFTDDTTEVWEKHGKLWFSVPYYDPLEEMLKGRRKFKEGSQ